MIAEPLETGLANEIEKGKVTMRMSNKERGKWFEEKYGWDLLASRNVWAFGPEESGPNVLINDTLPSEVSCIDIVTWHLVLVSVRITADMCRSTPSYC